MPYPHAESLGLALEMSSTLITVYAPWGTVTGSTDYTTLTRDGCIAVQHGDGPYDSTTVIPLALVQGWKLESQP